MILLVDTYQVNFHSGVTTGVEDLTSFDGLDRHFDELFYIPENIFFKLNIDHLGLYHHTIVEPVTKPVIRQVGEQKVKCRL